MWWNLMCSKHLFVLTLFWFEKTHALWWSGIFFCIFCLPIYAIIWFLYVLNTNYIWPTVIQGSSVALRSQLQFYSFVWIISFVIKRSKCISYHIILLHWRLKNDCRYGSDLIISSGNGRTTEVISSSLLFV